jgi:hypothetical protein
MNQPPPNSVLETLLTTFVVGKEGIQLTALEFFSSALTVNVDMSSGQDSGFSILPMADKIGTSSNRELGKSARTYDVLFSDGYKRAVLTLHHVFTPLVESGVLKSGSRVLVLRASPKSTKPAKPLGLTSSDTYIEQFGVLIQELRLLESDPSIVNDSQLVKLKDRLNNLPWAKGAVTDFRPQFTGRAHYLHSVSDDLSVTLPSWTKYATGVKHGLVDGMLPRRKLQLITKWNVIDGRPQDEGTNDVDIHLLTDETIPKEESLIYPPDFPSLKEVLNLVLRIRRRRRPWPIREAVNQAFVDPWTQLVVSHEDVAEAQKLNMDPIEMIRNQAVLNLSKKGGQLPLLGRISAIGQALHFGTLGMKDESYVPWRFEFWIVNEGMQLKVVCWNTAAVKFCLPIKNAGIGAIVGITGYRIKLDQLGNAEVALNNYHDSSVIVQLSTESIMEAFQKRIVFHSIIKAAPLIVREVDMLKLFPEPKLDFESSKTVYINKKSGEGCSICGIISRVGPLMRSTNFDNDFFRSSVSGRSSSSAALGGRDFIEYVDFISEDRATDQGGASLMAGGRTRSSLMQHSRVLTELGNTHQRSAGFGHSIMHSYRWVWLRDGNSFTDICIKLYTNSNIEVAGLMDLDKQILRPGVIAVFTHLRVCSTDKTGRLEGKNPSRPPLYLTSTDLTSAIFDKTEDPIVNERGSQIMKRLRSMMAKQSMSSSETSLILSNHPISKVITFHSLKVMKFETSILSFKPKTFFRLSSDPWPARSSFARPDSIQDLFFLLSSGLGENGPGVPRLEPNEVDLLRRSNLFVARALIEANVQSTLGPKAVLSSSSMVGFVDASSGGGSSSVSPTSVVRGLVRLQDRESITVVVVGRVARIRGTKKAAPARAKMAPLPAKQVVQQPIVLAEKQSSAPPINNPRKRGAAAAEIIDDDHDAESVEWEGPNLTRPKRSTASQGVAASSSAAAVSVASTSVGTDAKGNKTQVAAALSSSAAASKAQKAEDEQQIKDLEKQIVALKKGLYPRKVSKINNMTKAQLKASPKLLAASEQLNEVKKLKKKIEKLKAQIAAKPSGDKEETEVKPPPSKKTMLKTTATTATTVTASKPASSQAFPPPAPPAASTTLTARPSTMASFNLGEPDVDIGKIYRELHEAPRQIEDECCVHDVTTLSEALSHEAEAIASKDKRALEIERLRSSLKGKAGDASVLKKIDELENEVLRDDKGEKHFGFDAQHKLPFPLHVLTIAGADHGIDGKENFIDVLLHPSALLPHVPNLQQPLEKRCLSTEALRNFFPPSAPSSDDASTLKEFEEWAARKASSTSSSASASSTQAVSWESSKKFAFVLEVTNRSLDFPLSETASVTVTPQTSSGSASVAANTLKPLSSTRTRMATVRVIAIYEAESRER